MEPNFSGFVSKANLTCSDGRTIMPGAFAHQDGESVPLVYQHNHDDINQVLGTVKLTNKPEGTWGDVYLNPEVSAAKNADALVKHGDIKKFSIWAKDLVERGLDVIKGQIQEVSLVLGGANPGANIDNYQNVLAHAGLDSDDVLLVIGGEIVHTSTEETPAEEPKPEEKPAEEKPEEGDQTVADVLASLTDDQRTAVNSVIDGIVVEAVTEALTEEPQLEHSNTDSSKKGTKMSRNVFDRSKNNSAETGPELKHSDMKAVLLAAKGNPSEGIRGFNESTAVGSLKELVRSSAGKELMHADTYGIDNIEVLFPDAQALMRTPTFVDRRQEWVKVFMAGTGHSPFSRIKTMHADITADEARARGYIKGNQKDFEVFPVLKRTTGPALIYKMQKLDRQDIIDIVDFDVVAWMKVEMRGKLDEEIARAALFSDGRPIMVGGELNKDKIQEPTGTSGDGIRSIINDDDLYTMTVDVPLAADATGDDWNVLLDTAVEAGEHYRGSGNKTGFISFRTATRLLTIRDGFGKRMYRNLSEVAGDMEVSTLVRVPTELFPTDVLAIVLDLSDYNFGTNKGGEITLFDDFDIRFNQYLYLMETYLSGALTLPFSAIVFKRVDPTDTLVVPTAPVNVDNVITIPTQTGVVYRRLDTNAVVAGGSTITLDADDLPIVEIEAEPASDSYYFGSNRDDIDSWTFEYEA